MPKTIQLRKDRIIEVLEDTPVSPVQLIAILRILQHREFVLISRTDNGGVTWTASADSETTSKLIDRGVQYRNQCLAAERG